MGFFYERIETTSETNIRYSKAALFYFVMWPAFAFGWLAWMYGGLWSAASVVLFAMMFVFAAPFWSTNAEIKRAMKAGTVVVNGSKYSLSNPLTFVIKKDSYPVGQPGART